MDDKKNKQRKWDRDEVVILVTEYFKNKQSSTEQIDESYHRISEFLRKREEIITGKKVSDMFRNYAGIRMQTARICSLDPETELDGMQGTRLQKEVVEEFLKNPDSLYKEAEKIYKSFDDKY